MVSPKEQIKETVKGVQKHGQENVVFKTAHKSFQMGLGAMTLGKKEVDAMIKRLMEKGEVAEKDGRKMVDEWFNRSKKPVAKYEEKIEGMLDQRVESVLQVMNIPSRIDIEDLNKKIGALSRKVTELDKKLVAEKKLAA